MWSFGNVPQTWEQDYADDNTNLRQRDDMEVRNDLQSLVPTQMQNSAMIGVLVILAGPGACSGGWGGEPKVCGPLRDRRPYNRIFVSPKNCFWVTRGKKHG